MSPWLSVVGIGEDGLDGLSPAAQAIIKQAEILVGGKRHLAMLPEDGREHLAWPSPFDSQFEQLEAYRGQAVCVLASGDPNCYGVGTALAAQFGADALRVLPAPSAFSLACAQLGWSLAEVETLTLHGRPLALLHAYLAPGARLLILSEGSATPALIASLLCARGYGSSHMTVLEHMGGVKQRIESRTAETWPDSDGADLNSVAIECVASAAATLLPRTPGLIDAAYENDGQLTKREVRCMTLAALSPVVNQLLWDVGAGCGSVGIEWMRAARQTRAIAIENRTGRCRLIAANAAALGTPSLQIVHGDAPQALAGLPAPDAVFIGGGVSGAGVFDTCWAALKNGGRLVANVVSVEGEQMVTRWQQTIGGSLTRIAISRAEPIGRFQCWRPMMPVLQFAVSKNAGGPT